MDSEAQTNESAAKPASLWRLSLDAQREEETGFGEVLLLFAIGRVLAPFIIGATLWKLVGVFTNPGVWNALANPDSPAYHPLWMPTILFETTGIGLQLIVSLVILPLFFMRKRILPKVVIAYLAFVIAYISIDFILVGLIPAARAHRGAGTIIQLGFYTIVSAVWIVYFLMADRVKNTFTK